ncbi:MAG: hypothetical protein ACRD0G_05965 [Acidimicrobiales bacterium]
MGFRSFSTAIVLVWFLAGCGDDDVDPEADRERIEAALLTEDDLPDGFEEGEVDDDEEDSECNEEVLGLDDDEVDDARTAQTDPIQFESDTMTLRAEITAFESGDIPGRVLEAFDRDEYRECLEDEIGDELEEGVELTTIDGIDPLVDVDGVEAAAVAVGLDVSGTAAEARIYAAVIDRFGITLEASGVEGEIDEDVVADALEVMIERVQQG